MNFPTAPKSPCIVPAYVRVKNCSSWLCKNINGKKVKEYVYEPLCDAAYLNDWVARLFNVLCDVSLLVDAKINSTKNWSPPQTKKKFTCS